MKAPLSKKAQRLLLEEKFELVKKILIGSHNGISEEGHAITVGKDKKAYTLKKLTTDDADIPERGNV